MSKFWNINVFQKISFCFADNFFQFITLKQTIIFSQLQLVNNLFMKKVPPPPPDKKIIVRLLWMPETYSMLVPNDLIAIKGVIDLVYSVRDGTCSNIWIQNQLISDWRSFSGLYFWYFCFIQLADKLLSDFLLCSEFTFVSIKLNNDTAFKLYFNPIRPRLFACSSQR